MNKVRVKLYKEPSTFFYNIILALSVTLTIRILINII